MVPPKPLTTVLATLLTLTVPTTAAYTLKTDLSHTNFFSNFAHYTGPDPTKGFVQYLSHDAAVQAGLVGYLNTSVFLGSDYTSKDARGRASVRLESIPTFNRGLLVADITHMPSSGCGSWPAFWMLGKEKWPLGGEVDILEGVNDYQHNAVTLHTSPGCIVDNATSSSSSSSSSSTDELPYTGTMKTSNCDVAAPGQGKNVGCSIHAAPAGSPDHLPTYGSAFNTQGGGIYVVELTSTSISTWIFPRSTTNTTLLASLLSSPNPSTFPAPIARFSGSGCDFERRFRDMRVIFNTAFCGVWAAGEWETGGCAKKTGVKKCADYVRENPEAFLEAYWEIGGLRWFEDDGIKKVARSVRW
ncbi:concanavalin A-like lectin/glucanase domain-containing protein [Dendryphion nanum]|uniref:Concanavalin A-like lectin/glucanase domain-containing protein n=1 Tax=Dendryphion nanum TaxID=256645 RepID=A0A9P9EEK5_9PLEO|nr:concanavalin A-like lectin/glucanase domain-containing protein [Dendryphion nanum]